MGEHRPEVTAKLGSTVKVGSTFDTHTKKELIRNCFWRINFKFAYWRLKLRTEYAKIVWVGTTFSLLELGTLYGNQHFSLVRSRPFTGTGGFLASLFTFLSRQPVVNRLRASGRNCLELSSWLCKKQVSFLHGLSQHHAEQWNVGLADKWSKKLVLRPETDVDSELSMTSFNVTHPVWAAEVWTSKRHRLSAQETVLSKVFS